MKIKLSNNNLLNYLTQIYNCQGHYYKSVGLTEEEFEDFCPDHPFYGGKGWQRFLEKYPEKKPSDTIEVECFLPEKLIPILVVAAQFTFQKLGLQAQKGIDTNETENILLKIKRGFQYLQYAQFCLFTLTDIWWKVDRDTPLSILRQISGEDEYYILTEKDIVVNYLTISFKKFHIYFCQFSEKTIPLPAIKWTGKELVAIHTENLPQIVLEKVLEKGLLQIEDKGGEKK